MNFFAICVVLLFQGVFCTEASTTIRVWHGNVGGSITLPCGTAITPVEQCTWAVPQDDSGTCSGTHDVPMASITVGEYLGLAAAGEGRPCDLLLDNLTRGHEGLWTCEASTFQLLVKGVSDPTFFVDGRPQTNGSLLTTLDTRTHTLQCSVLWSRPAANIRWVVGDHTDLSADATTASSPSGTVGGVGGCPLVDGDNTWQVSSTLPLSFTAGDQSVSCLVAHDSLTGDKAITLRLDVDSGAPSLTSGTISLVGCLVAGIAVLLHTSSS